MKANKDLTRQQIDDIINRCSVCHIAMVDSNGLPYVLPFNFSFINGYIYIHGASNGKKNEIWNTNPNVCVSFSADYQMYAQSPNVACSYSMKYRSVLINGTIECINEIEEKRSILKTIMGKYAQKSDLDFSLPALKNVAVYKITPTSIEGKTYGY